MSHCSVGLGVGCDMETYYSHKYCKVYTGLSKLMEGAESSPRVIGKGSANNLFIESSLSLIEK